MPKHHLQGASCLFWTADVVDWNGELDWKLEVLNKESAQAILPLVVPAGADYSLAFHTSRLAEDDPAADLISTRALKSGKTGYQQEFRVRKADGETALLFEAVSIEVVSKGRWRLIGVCTDVTEERRYRSQLVHNEQRYRFLFESNPLPMYVTGLDDLRILEANEAALRQYGYLRDEFIGLDVKQIRVPEERDMLQEQANRQDLGLVNWGVLRHRRKDGTPLFVDAKSLIAYDLTSDGTPVRLTLAVDVTERLMADQALRRNQETLASAQQLARMGSWTYDLSTDRFDLSDEFFRIVGWDRGSFVPCWETVIGMVHPDDRATIVLSDLMAASAEGSIEGQFRIMRPDGETRYATSRVHGTFDPDGLVSGFEGTLQDITDEHLQRQELLWKTAFLEAQVNSSIDGILVLNKDGKRILQNDRVRELWKIPQEIWDMPTGRLQLGHTISMCKDKAQIEKQITQLSSDPLAVSQDEIELVDGRFLDQYTAPVQGHDGALYGRIWLFRDITEHKRASEQLERSVTERTAQLESSNRALKGAKEEADRANSAKSEFLSRMSHELRTPLNSIIGFGQILEMQNSDPELDESISYILKGGRHLLDLINEILDIARVESGRMQVYHRPLRISDLLEEACILMRPAAMAHQIVIDAGNSSASHLSVLADPQRLKQVLINLISNGIKYNEPGGIVAFTCFTRPNGNVCIEVRDNGWGISDSDLKRLFTPFDRLAASNSDVEGTGLGLVLSRRLVESMGGVLTVESTLGKGSVFRIELQQPLDESVTKTESNGTSARDDGWAPGDVVVLCIESDPSLLRFFELVATMRPNLRLLTAIQGGLGVELARQHVPDVILLDNALADMSHEEVIAMLQLDASTAGIPIACLISEPLEGDNEIRRCPTSRWHLTKPIDVEKFLSVIDQLEPRPFDSYR
ncbi:MAG: PAS domain S-box protein [Fimbriimonas sp.]|nr:PAS domain S-box protein [Fimbriimonas sp.]